jgi:signal transduction histidine kinase
VLEAWEADDQRAVFTRVTNRGGPIPPSLANRLFDAFARSDAHGGLGLGLYIVAQIARAHGGSCEVSSNEEATAFTIRWPRTPLREAPDRT